MKPHSAGKYGWDGCTYMRLSKNDEVSTAEMDLLVGVETQPKFQICHGFRGTQQKRLMQAPE